MTRPDGPRACAVTLRSFDGPFARELFVHVAPPSGATSEEQARFIYRELASVLADHGGGPGHTVRQTVLCRDVSSDARVALRARHEVARQCGGADWAGAVTDVQQPPLDSGAALDVLLHAVIPNGNETSGGTTGDDGPPSARLRVGPDERLYLGNVVGDGATAAEQTASMFEHADRRLRAAGFAFSDVARTWLYLRDIDADYPALNAARRTFFDSRNLAVAPASTGIAGGHAVPASKIAMALYAVRGPGGPGRAIMTSPTLNEASSYGADFVRGMRIDEGNRTALHVSGTASVDENGATVHQGDIVRQAERMLVNIEALLAGQGAETRHIVSATTYVKHAKDADALRACFAQAGFTGFPNPLVAAPVCRADLLCETELLALLPASS